MEPQTGKGGKEMIILCNKFKSQIRSIPILGGVLMWIHSKLHKFSPSYLYTYVLKPKIASKAIKTLRRIIKVNSIIIMNTETIINSGVAKFYWKTQDPYSLLGYPLRGDFEQAETTIAVEISKTSKIIVDVGGNFGWYACHLLASMESGGEIHIFEPAPSILPELYRNLELNSRADIQVVVNETCLSDKVGEVVLHVPLSVGEAFASIEVQKDYGRSNKIVREAETLDSYCKRKNIQYIDFLKIDVEGAELKVLMGAREILSSNHKPVILVESWGPIVKAFGYTVKDVVSFIKDLGYEGYIFKTSGEFYRLTDENLEVGYDYIFVGCEDTSRINVLNKFLNKDNVLGG